MKTFGYSKSQFKGTFYAGWNTFKSVFNVFFHKQVFEICPSFQLSMTNHYKYRLITEIKNINFLEKHVKNDGKKQNLF